MESLSAWQMPASGASLNLLLQQLRRRTAQVPHEIGAFVVLQACEIVLDRPSLVDPDNVWVGRDGGVHVNDMPTDVDETRIAQSLQSLLRCVSEASGICTPPRIQRLLDPQLTSLPLEQLRAAIITALVPLNRAASKRVLSRLLREAMHQMSQVAKITVGSESDLDHSVAQSSQIAESATASASAQLSLALDELAAQAELSVQQRWFALSGN